MVKLVTGGLLITLAALTFSHNRVWTDPVLLWQQAVDRAPTKPRPYINLGIAYEGVGDDRAAWVAYRQAHVLSRDPRRHPVQQAFVKAAAEVNLAHLYAKYGDPLSALDVLDGVLERQPELASAIFNRSAVLARLGRCREAIPEWRRAIAIDPALPRNPCTEVR